MHPLRRIFAGTVRIFYFHPSVQVQGVQAQGVW